MTVERRARFSARARVIHGAARLVARPVFRYWPLTPAALRVAPLLERAAGLRRAPAGTHTEPVRLNGFDSEWVRADGVTERGAAVLYLHGGGFVIGGVGTHRRCVAALSRTSRLPVLSVAYRQYPVADPAGSTADGLTA